MIANQRGSALVMVLAFSAIVAVGAMASLVHIKSELNLTMRNNDLTRAFYMAEAGLERAKGELHEDFHAYFNSNGMLSTTFNWFDSYDSSTYYSSGTSSSHSFSTTGDTAEGSYQVQITDVSVSNEGRNVTFQATGTVPTWEGGTVSRTIQSVVYYGLEASNVFDYAYFVNNFGWMWGSTITANGDVRSNGDFSYNYNPEINGDTYASDNPALSGAPSGNVTGSTNNLSLSSYRSTYSSSTSTARPTDPPVDGGASYPAGYDGTSQEFEGQEPLEMPYIGDLSIYESVAASQSGTISQNGSTLVSGTYDGDGPDGVNGTPDDGVLVLEGTVANPIEINGPVVIEGDVMIKGVVSGQGTIYAGRNVHILDDITYSDAPGWPKPDSNHDSTVSTNNTKDALALVAKGNVVVGDYTSSQYTKYLGYMKPPFVDAYDVDSSDAVNGYTGTAHYNGVLDPGEDTNGNGVLDSGEDILRTQFDGDYTDYDGGSKDDGTGNATNRKYYESSMSDSWMSTNATGGYSVDRIDAITYTNHAWTGRVGALDMNGTIVARNEAIIYSGTLDMHYDPRVHSSNDTSISGLYLPRVLADPSLVSWEEV